MAKITRAVAILALFTVVAIGCSQPSMRAKSDMHEGKRALDDGEFAVAQELFMRSAEAQPSAAAYAFAATAAYNVNDLTNAAAFIEKAGAFKGGSNVYLRVLAYKALISYRQARYAEAAYAVKAYLAVGNSYYPIRNADIVRRITSTSPIDLTYLQALLEYDLRRYESDIVQWQTEGTGYFSYKYGPPVSQTLPDW